MALRLEMDGCHRVVVADFPRSPRFMLRALDLIVDAVARSVTRIQVSYRYAVQETCLVCMYVRDPGKFSPTCAEAHVQWSLREGRYVY